MLDVVEARTRTVLERPVGKPATNETPPTQTR